MRFAEVIGDPIAQSKSPAIHRFWLDALGLDGDYIATRVTADRLEAHLAERRANPDWRGCNVTIPHKEVVLPLLARIDEPAKAIGSANIVAPCEGGLGGWNSDIDGIGEALAGIRIAGEKCVLIGAGGAARAALRYLLDARARKVVLLVRDPEKGKALANVAPERVTVEPFDTADRVLAGAALIVNSTPLGMTGARPMPPPLLASIAANAKDTSVFDMVYNPLETELLRVARLAGATGIDGLTMLIGQARAAFALFFGEEPPRHLDPDLRAMLTGSAQV